MKRSKCLNLVAMGVGAGSISGCSDPTSVVYYRDVAECNDHGFLKSEQCTAAYSKARQRNLDIATRFYSRSACEKEFGYGNCVKLQRGGTWYIPKMAGFMAEIDDGYDDDDNGGHYYHGGYYGTMPLYRSRYHGHEYRTIRGDFVGKADRYGKTQVSSSYTKPVNKAKTVNRGGWGSTASAKTSSYRSWGG